MSLDHISEVIQKTIEKTGYLTNYQRRYLARQVGRERKMMHYHQYLKRWIEKYQLT